MSDVPLGAFLSGGVDSAYVVAAMKAVSPTSPRAFSIAFREEAYNEGPAATAIARYIGVDHVVETLSVADLLADLAATRSLARDPSARTVFKSVGTALEDLAAAILVYESRQASAHS